MTRIGLICLFVFCGMLAPLSSRAQVDTLSGSTFQKEYDGTIRGDISRVFMSHELKGSLLMKRGWNMSGRMGMSESFYRLQDRKDEAKDISVNLAMPLTPRFLLTGSLLDGRFFNRVVTFSGDVQNFQNNSRDARARLSYLNTFATRVRVNAWGEAGVKKSEQTFLEDLYQEGSLGGEVNYTLGRLSLNGRGFMRTTGGSASSGPSTHGGLGINEDSLATTVNMRVAASTNVNAYYHRFSYTNEFMDLPRGVFLEQQFNENLVREVETRTAEILKVNAVSNPNGAIQVILGMERSETDNRFVTAAKRNARTVTDAVRAQVVYNMRPNLTFRFNMDNLDVLHDLGENSLGTYTDKRQSIRASAIYSPTRTFQLQLTAGNALYQNFYRDFIVNPRDRDQLDQFINLSINSQPFPKIAAEILMSASQNDFVNISGTLSQNNRKETTFDFRPKFTYKITNRVELKQRYGLNIEFSDFVFTPDENFLDRNFLFGNTVRVYLTTRLSATMDYSLLLHDRGSYLAPFPGAERLLDIDQKDRRDVIDLDFRYAVTPRLALLGGYDFTTRRDLNNVSNVPAFRDGGLELGAEGAYAWGTNRNLRFRLIKVNRFGRFNSAKQEDFWNMDSMLTFQF